MVTLAAVELSRQEQAAPRAAAVDEHRAGAAHAVLAAHVRAGEPEVLAEEVRERAARLDGALDRAPLTVKRTVSRSLGVVLTAAPRGAAGRAPGAARAP